MDLILFDGNYQEIGIAYITGDFEIGDSDALNNFEVSGGPLSIGKGIYVEGTEVGGIVEKAVYSMDSVPVYSGWTWRGLLTQDIIIPPSGSDYRIVSGEANSVIKSLISESGLLSAVFDGVASNSGITIESYQFNLYCTYLDGLMDMLSTNGAKLVIEAYKSAIDKRVHVKLSAEPQVTKSGRYNEDVRLKMTFTDDRMGINHLVCMGSGDLQERQRVDLYADNNGNISQTQHYTGLNERTEYYDYGSAESLQDLIDKGTEQLKSVMSGKTLKIDSESEELDIGDIVTGTYTEKDEMTGETITVSVSAPINKKTYTFDKDGVSIDYGLKEGK